MTDSFKIVYPAAMDHLADFLVSIVQWLKDQGLPDKRIFEIELAAEEALVNIFHYAYPNDPGSVEVVCRTEPENRLVIEFTDKGVPFNPLLKVDPDMTPVLQERKIGGLGIYFIKTLMDDVRYRREGDKNILSFLVSKGKQG
jgi:serine/threonine-protein kinase RsbW